MSPTILIVEDHDAMRSALREWLETVFPHCRVIEAANAEQAIPIAQAELPKVIVMDIGLPQMNGIEASRRIKTSVPSAQVVILTIHEDKAYRADAKAAGVSAYVPKRAMQTELVSTLAALLSDRKNQEGEG